ncbi:hypothetical protein Q0M94_28320 (plasmid) [Deinococcus radiomollis]|uniref:hypothetical protein n=1 Tax=Deinococcus radiomollis TaxID=468916 RepID=UPI003892A0FC
MTLTIEAVTASLQEHTRTHRLPEVTSEIRRRYLYRELIRAGVLSVTDEVQKCRTDVVHFFNHWVWTYDPRGMALGLPATLPFVLRPKQVELTRWLLQRERSQTSGLIEKSRDEGMSYVVLGFFLHHWLFVEGFAAGVGSRKEEYVDKKGDPKTLFHKFRDMLGKLPDFLQPEGFTEKVHDNYMRIVNPANEASLTGEAGDNIGRGGRTTMYLLDEWAYHPSQDTVDAAISQNTNVRLKGSTPNGVGDRFYQDRMSGKYPVFTMPWRENPDKNWTALVEGQEVHPWYEKQRLELDEVVLAQEVDIDYAASAEGVVIPAKWVQAALNLKLSEAGTRAAGADVAEEGADKSAYVGRAGPVVLPSLKRFQGLHVSSELKEWAASDAITSLNYDRLGVGASITATLAKEIDLGFTVRGIANSETPSATVYPDAQARASERFFNFAAELWWRLRLRFRNTWERVTQGIPHPDEECITLAELAGHALLPSLLAQLSQPIYSKHGVADKLRVDKKGKGTQSPDLAEALMYSYAPPAAVYTPPDFSVDGFSGYA